MKFDELDFSEGRYRELLRLSIKLDYKPIFFSEEENIDKFILWRHDIDLELPAALKIAHIEKEEKIRSTYFFMTRSWFYNIFNRQGIEIINEIVSLDHQVALHCDLEVPRYKEIKYGNVEDKVAQDFYLLEKVFGENTFKRVVSFHNPPNSILKKDFPSFYSTYSEKFFGEIKYLSDSNRIWREDSPEKFLSRNNIKKFSILLHPVIWTYPRGTMSDAMHYFLNTRYNVTRKKLIDDDIRINE